MLCCVSENAYSRYIPGSYAYSHISPYGDIYTFIDPGYYAEYRRIDISLKIIDVKNGETIWIANGDSSGDECGFSELIDDITKKTLSTLSEKGLIKKKN